VDYDGFLTWIWMKSSDFMIIRYLASGQKSQEYKWRILDNWAFRSSLPIGRRLLSSVPIRKENKATGIIADTRIRFIPFSKVSFLTYQKADRSLTFVSFF
jgi:hypothetical protein